MPNWKWNALNRAESGFLSFAHLAIIIPFLAGCVAVVEADVTRFHTLTPSPSIKTFKVLPSDKNKEGSLEFNAYAEKVKNRLKETGYFSHEPTDKPDYIVFLGYSIGDGQTKIGSSPIIGKTGGGTAYQSGSVSSGYGGFGSYSGTTYSPVTYGVVGSRTYQYTEYTRVLKLDIVEAVKTRNDRIHRVFEGKAVSTGSSGLFAEASDCIIDALFEDFPGVSGETKNVVLELDSCGKPKVAPIPLQKQVHVKTPKAPIETLIEPTVKEDEGGGLRALESDIEEFFDSFKKKLSDLIN